VYLVDLIFRLVLIQVLLVGYKLILVLPIGF